MTSCNYCGSAAQQTVVDERTGATYCSRYCFADWAGDNAAEVAAQYEKLYVTEAV